MYKFTPKKQVASHINQQYRNIFGRDVDFDNPKTINEKIQWLKIHYRDSKLTKCTDKYAVRKYVAKTIGKKYLPGLIGVYSSVDEINFESLPHKFALKTTNGSGTNIICSNIDNFKVDVARQRLSDWLKPESNHYYHGYEWSYKYIKPKIICEEFLGEQGNLKDYKFFCFNGVPRFIYVSTEYGSKEQIDIDFFDTNWNKLPYTRKAYKGHGNTPEKPQNLQLMLNLATKLAKDFPFVRIDFFDTKDRVVFSEMTFYPANGVGAFEDYQHDLEIGSMLSLPKKTGFAKRLASSVFSTLAI